jgi:hypothetical protein
VTTLSSKSIRTTKCLKNWALTRPSIPCHRFGPPGVAGGAGDVVHRRTFYSFVGKHLTGSIQDAPPPFCGFVGRFGHDPFSAEKKLHTVRNIFSVRCPNENVSGRVG